MLVGIVLVVFVPAIFAFPLVMCWVEERLYQVTPVRAALPPLVPTPVPAARRREGASVSTLPSHRRSRVPRLRNRRAAA